MRTKLRSPQLSKLKKKKKKTHVRFMGHVAKYSTYEVTQVACFFYFLLENFAHVLTLQDWRPRLSFRYYEQRA